MVLAPGTVEYPMYSGQAKMQKRLLVIAGVSVPVLLFIKSYFLSNGITTTQYDSVPHDANDDVVSDNIQLGTVVETIDGNNY